MLPSKLKNRPDLSSKHYRSSAGYRGKKIAKFRSVMGATQVNLGGFRQRSAGG